MLCVNECLKVFLGIVYGGLAFAVGFSTIVAIGGDASKRRVSGAGAMFGVNAIYLRINFARKQNIQN